MDLIEPEKKMCFVLIWDNFGAAGLELQISSIINRLISMSSIKIDVIIIVSNKVDENEICKHFAENINIIFIIAQRIRNSIFPISKILSQHKYDLIIGANPQISNMLFIAKLISGKKVSIITINQGFNRKNFISKIQVIMNQFISCSIIVVSHELKKEIENICPILKRKIHVIPNGLSIQSIKEKANEPITEYEWIWLDNNKTVIYVGRLDEKQKNVSLLLNAFKSVSDGNENIRLLLIGDGKDKTEYLNYVQQNNLTHRVFFLGWIDNPYPFIKKSDILVLPSRYEGFGRVLVEALALGISIVSSDCPSGPQEILINGKYGALFKSEDVDSLINTINEVLKSPFDPEISKQRALDFNQESMTDKYYKIIIEKIFNK